MTNASWLISSPVRCALSVLTGARWDATPFVSMLGESECSALPKLDSSDEMSIVPWWYARCEMILYAEPETWRVS